MTELELIFSIREVTRDIGAVAGNTRRDLEKKCGRKGVTNENCLVLTQAAKKAAGVK